MKPRRKGSTSCFTDVQISNKERADSVYLSLTVVHKSCLKCSSPCRPPPLPLLIACVNSYLLSFPVKLGEAREERHVSWWCLDHTLWRALMHTNGKEKKEKKKKRDREKTLERYISLNSTRRPNHILHNPQAVCLKIRIQDAGPRWTLSFDLRAWFRWSMRAYSGTEGHQKNQKLLAGD